MGDEEVIRRRLLIDGDGTGDDRRLNVLLKTLTKWCNTDEKSEDSAVSHDRMLAQLAQCEFAVSKSQLAAQMTAAELRSYERLSKMLETGIEAAKRNIEGSKKELVAARRVRAHRVQYDVLARVIGAQPERRRTLAQLRHVHRDLASLHATKHLLHTRLSLRRKQFQVLVTSLHQLQALLDQPDEENLSSSPPASPAPDEPMEAPETTMA